jgi:hypothetical protein
MMQSVSKQSNLECRENADLICLQLLTYLLDEKDYDLFFKTFKNHFHSYKNNFESL